MRRVVKYAVVLLVLSAASANAQAVVDKSAENLDEAAVGAMIEDVSANLPIHLLRSSSHCGSVTGTRGRSAER